jgi:hypothetical protein
MIRRRKRFLLTAFVILGAAFFIASPVLSLAQSDTPRSVSPRSPNQTGTKSNAKSSVKAPVKSSSKPNSTPNSKSIKKPTKARYFVVVAPETYVYEKPDLDSKAFGLLPQGTRLPVSRGTRGEYAKFYRTRFKGKLGWVLTIDLKPESVVRKAIEDSKSKSPPKGPFAAEQEAGDEESGEKKPFIFSQSASFVAGLTQFKEAVDGVAQSVQLPVYGVRVLGPDVILAGPIVDFGLLLHYGAPPYYSQASSTTPNGFLLWTEALLMMPIRMRESSWLGIGAGPVLALSNIQTTRGLETHDSFDARLGVSVSFTGAVRFDEFLVRGDLRYVWVGESYPQATLGLGTVF